MNKWANLTLSILFFSTFTTQIYADNNTINGSCPGEEITMIGSATYTTADGKNGAGRIGYGGNDRYYIDIPRSGTLEIAVVNNEPDRNENYYFYVSKNKCGNKDNDWNIISKAYGKTHNTSVPVSTGDRVYIRLQSIKSEPNNGKFAYAIKLNFTPSTTDFSSGFKDFELINPTNTRNILGNFAIAGNTVMCLTELTKGYADDEDECHGMNDFQYLTSNLRVSKYIDIDNDAKTWNSTSSYIVLPDTYDPNRGILWAGLFWQGRFSNDEDSELHYAVETDDGYNYIEIGKGSSIYEEGDSINVQDHFAHKIRLKINNGVNHEVTASEVNTFASSNGVTYDAFADVTKLLQEAKLDKGKHVFTVSNLRTAEGREYSPGVFGGWTLVVIYAEDFNGKFRNISVYNGFVSLGTNTPLINISGFRLPETGEVNAQISVFSGEGEYLYGLNPINPNSQDWMKISDSSDPSTFDYMPGMPSGTDVGNRDNLFDATFDGILRDSIPGKYNDLQINNDGVDVDHFDVSELMTSYRDKNPDIQEVFIQVFSNNDYVTPGMIAFSTELYQPRLCYDYVVRKDNYTLNVKDRLVYTSAPGTLAYNVSIRSMEGDFDLTNAKLSLRPSPTDDLSFIDARYSPDPINVLVPAIYTSAHQPPSKPEIAMGTKATTQGGIISSFERYFSVFRYELSKGNYQGKFEVDLNVSIDFGSGPVSYILSSESGSLPRCEQNLTYNPQYGMFNIERIDSANFDPISQPAERFTLYTQTVGKDFDFSLVAYDANATPPFSKPLVMPYDLAVEIELIDAKPYDDNGSFFKCHNTDDSIIQNLSQNTKSFFAVIRQGTSRLDFSDADDIKTDTALENAAFRIWTVTDANNNIVPHKCIEKSDDTCFSEVYQDYIKPQDTQGLCAQACGSNPSGCYQCIRDYFASPICSRDNFAIKPTSFHIAVSDTNETLDYTQPIELTDNLADNATVAQLSAGYKYQLDVYTTRYDEDAPALGYTAIYNPDIDKQERQAKLIFNTQNVTSCADTDDKDYMLYFENGTLKYVESDGKNGFSPQDGTLFAFQNVGDYTLRFEDRSWTLVDQKRYPYKTFPGVDDCKPDAYDVADNTSVEKSGCFFSSEFDNTSASAQYKDLTLKYHPYAFIFQTAPYLSVSPDSASKIFSNYIYMNDLLQDKSAHFAFVINTTVHAVAQNNNVSDPRQLPVTTNFTQGCVANDLTVTLAFASNPKLDTIRELQWFVKTEDLNLSQEINASLLAQNNRSTLPKTLFKDEDNGTANVNIYTNVKRPQWDIAEANTTLRNPIQITYRELNITSPANVASAHLSSKYLPGSKETGEINATRFFYYAKADVADPYNDQPIISYKQRESFLLGTWVYCQDPVSADLDCNAVGLGDTDLYPQSGAGVNWYKMTPHDGSIGMGRIESFTQTADGITYTPEAPYNLDSNGTTKVELFYPLASLRPFTTFVTFKASPWLDIGKKLEIRFLGNEFRWKGEGKTGHVVDDGASIQDNQKRIGW